ncbi:hypothetical protein [Flavobacterium weaverense]|uniref:Uncharacterized protein n=1 Tax=Flavobacterium weaverense TaxID=271156 RepID=A0A3M0A583_9FLAO|nr:hypothetical protein [Flavobacterium weaverense]RMA77948.1 hypothetical protein BC961_0308 [Flavobacterium weaverense]
MESLKIEFTGGYRQASKYLTREHSANFAVIVDALVYIHNENKDKLVIINGSRAVRASNAYLSRHTGLGLSIIKSNIDKIVRTGLVTVITRGQGNTRHYVINIENINTYITALKPKFERWFEKSIDSSKKDKARSVKADNVKLKKSLEDFTKTMAELKLTTVESEVGLVENRLTKSVKTDQPNRLKYTVEEREEERAEETTTKKKDVVVTVFNQRDSKGAFTIFKGYDKPVYEEEYKEYTKNFTKKQFEKILDAAQEGAYEDMDVDLDDLNFTNEFTYKKDEKMCSKFYYKDEIMGHTYNSILRAKRTNEQMKKKEYETTNEPASPDISNNNWKILKNAYSELPDIPKQGRFLPSKQDESNFSNLSEYRQGWVIEQVVNMKKANTTASRPANYIEEAMKEKLNLRYNPDKSRLNVAL